jgi:hypothetical protein
MFLMHFDFMVDQNPWVRIPLFKGISDTLLVLTYAIYVIYPFHAMKLLCNFIRDYVIVCNNFIYAIYCSLCCRMSCVFSFEVNCTVN